MSEQTLTREVEAMDTGSGEWEPKIVAFLCAGCGYTGVDQAGAGRIQYPSNVRIIQVPCAGRIDPFFVLKSLQRGADGVMIVGCHSASCHYTRGSALAHQRAALLGNLLEFVGLERGRIQFFTLGGTEALQFVRMVTDVVDRIKTLGPAKALVKDGSHLAPVPQA